MSVVKVRELYQNGESLDGKEITVCGWARSIRDMKAFGFIELNDGSCFKGVQVVLDETRLLNFSDIVSQNVGAAFVATGTFKLTPDAKQAFEILATDVAVEGESTPEYPLQKKRHSPEFLRTIAHLRPRTNLFSAVFRIRSVAAHAIHCFFQERGFVYVHTPIITCSDAEGAGEMFHVTTDHKEDFFGKPAGLTVSGQLNAEAYALAFSDVYTFGPTFRAENSNTPRHAAEFWMIEPEIAFADLADDMKLAEDMLKYIIEKVLESCPFEMEFLDNFVCKGLLERLKSVANSKFGHITYTEAIELLSSAGENFEFPVFWGCDLQTEHERFLSEKQFKKPVFVTDYPKDIKAFYMRLSDDEKTVAAMDLLVPGVGELIGGSQREERMDILTRRIEEMGLEVESYGWYLDLRRFGGTKHAGFGIGFERLIMYLTGVSNIRDVVPFPRTVGSAEF
ncbi:MAG: asparagine--tRNA ligase [Oscillospiraceae bacterium]|nr:asparagine--tRNA ligase [Oscillospiraceae bacterium]MCL2277999.1 asparagine--tRNA ligase [Oscillospiraceae bacterium]